MCLAFPDLYDIGMSHMGTKILYKLLNDQKGIQAERAFAPWLDMEKALRERELPLLSLESATPLSGFDVVGFSLQYELTFTNVLNMLDLGGYLFATETDLNPTRLIIAGGPVATHPEPIAPFIDIFLIGDAEEKLPELLRTWRELQEDASLNRIDRIRKLVRIGSLYAPELYERQEDERTGLQAVVPPENDEAPYPVMRAILDDLDRIRSPMTPLSP